MPRTIDGEEHDAASSMAHEYGERRGRRWLRALDRLLAWPGDLRSRRSREAFLAVVDGSEDGSILLSIGGGPNRAHPRLVNLNIGPFENVEIVATAYLLPFREGTVDEFHCEAVLEHLEFPEVAVEEMYRVLRPAAELYAATPFLQVFHGYPEHFQNFTLHGHVRLFERAGFEVIDSGTAVGPTFALVDLARNYARAAVPTRLLAALSFRLVTLVGMPLRLLDLLLNKRPGAHVLASLTYLRARKPVGGRASGLELAGNDLVHVAPDPALAGLDRSDQGMA